MKIRNSFVANSSSSSFIVIFKRKPRSAKDVLKALFPNYVRESSFNLYDYTATVGEIVDQVFTDLQEQRRATEKRIMEELSSGHEGFQLYARKDDISKYKDLERKNERDSNSYYKRYHEIRGRLGIEPMDSLPKVTKKNTKIFDEYKQNEKEWRQFNNAYWEKREKLRKKMARHSAKKFIEKHKDKWIAVVSYADEDGNFFSLMEHGGIFDNIDHIRISHH